MCHIFQKGFVEVLQRVLQRRRTPKQLLSAKEQNFLNLSNILQKTCG
jgi:hypothetical protein